MTLMALTNSSRIKVIKELEIRLANLKKDEANYQAQPDNIKLAELLHEKLCHTNHTDGCGWYYESWDKPDHAKKIYLEKANEMLAKYTFEQAAGMFSLIEGI